MGSKPPDACPVGDIELNTSIYKCNRGRINSSCKLPLSMYTNNALIYIAQYGDAIELKKAKDKIRKSQSRLCKYR